MEFVFFQHLQQQITMQQIFRVLIKSNQWNTIYCVALNVQSCSSLSNVQANKRFNKIKYSNNIQDGVVQFFRLNVCIGVSNTVAPVDVIQFNSQFHIREQITKSSSTSWTKCIQYKSDYDNAATDCVPECMCAAFICALTCTESLTCSAII